MTIKKKTDLDKLKEIFPCKIITISGNRELTVKPIPLPQITLLYDCIEEIMIAFDKKGIQITTESFSDVKNFFAVATVEVLKLIKLIQKIDDEFLNSLTINDGILILDAIIDINDIASILKNVTSLGQKIKNINLI